MNVYLLMGGTIALVALGSLLGALWAHRRETKRRWARYQPTPGAGEPPSVVCPSCRRRWYSARVIRERVCPGCEREF